MLVFRHGGGVAGPAPTCSPERERGPAGARTPPLTILSAASEPFWRSLHQFLASARRHRLHLAHRFRVYDLGLRADTRQRLEGRFPWCEFRAFDFAAYPPHVARDLGNFAWKPLAFFDAVAGGQGYFLWLDSASLFRTADLEEVYGALDRGVLYCLAGQTPLWRCCDPKTLAALDAPAELLHRPERAAGVLGIDAANPAMRQLVAEWRAHALVPHHLAPGSGTRHQFDQSLLSILAYKAEAAGRIALFDGEIDISSHRPVRWISTRNKVPAAMPLFADPLVRAWYAAYKTADRIAWRLLHLRDTRVHGWNRFLNERFTVYVGQKGRSRLCRIRARRGSYYADPFVLTRGGSNWLLAEEFRYAECRGRLVALPLDEQLRAGSPVPILSLPVHASFPLPFEHQGDLYLLPETYQNAAIDLYICETFPDRWRLARRLVHGIAAVDTVPLFHEGRWWLLTSAMNPDDGTLSLAIFFADDLLNGEWVAHPVNAERRYAGVGWGSFRNAGPVRSVDGAILRVIQDNPRYYGSGVRVMRILTLTPTAFHEVPDDGDDVTARIARKFATHHISESGDLFAFDSRDWVGLAHRIPFPVRLWGGPDPRALSLARADETALSRFAADLA